MDSQKEVTKNRIVFYLFCKDLFWWNIDKVQGKAQFHYMQTYYDKRKFNNK